MNEPQGTLKGLFYSMNPEANRRLEEAFTTGQRAERRKWRKVFIVLCLLMVATLLIAKRAAHAQTFPIHDTGGSEQEPF